MTKTTVQGIVTAALALLPLLSATPANAVPITLTLSEGIQGLPVATESRAGYQRSSFKHWIDVDQDRCNTREEVLVSESLTPATVDTECRVTAGTWFSYYDEQTITQPGSLDIDHMVPLAEAWDSGASAWTPARRQAYANDLAGQRSLVAVTAKTNRSKADQDPAEWLPPSDDARCLYAGDWVATKLRWRLTADQAEIDALRRLAVVCGGGNIEYEVAP